MRLQRNCLETPLFIYVPDTGSVAEKTTSYIMHVRTAEKRIKHPGRDPGVRHLSGQPPREQRRAHGQPSCLRRQRVTHLIM